MSVRRPLLLPLVSLYGFGLAWKNRRFDRGGAEMYHLHSPVVSVGSISAGGAGKTPFLIALAALLREMGYEPDVLSRGYGRRDRTVRQVDRSGSADEFGDEPLMLARVLSCRVFVGADRFAAGVFSERSSTDLGQTIHLLDDGFSHRRLARTIDIALLTLEDLTDCLLPAGNLREPLRALTRADVFVLRREEMDAVRPVLERVFPLWDTKKIWTVRRTLRLPARLAARPLAFCGLARPADFEASLRQSGVAFVECRRFRDHHRYTLADAQALCRRAHETGADAFLTTAKDAVKLDVTLRSVLEKTGPVAVVDVQVALLDKERCVEDLKCMLSVRSKKAKDA